MGCGPSRLDTKNEGDVPTRPLIRRRLDEIRARVGSFNSKNDHNAQDSPEKNTNDSPSKEGNVGKKEKYLEVEGDDEEVDERMLSERDRSPSFRVYCAKNVHISPSREGKEEEFEGFGDHDDAKEEQSCNVNEESLNSNDVSVSPNNQASMKNQSKKGRRGRKFKKPKFQMHGFQIHRSSNSNPHILHRATIA